MDTKEIEAITFQQLKNLNQPKFNPSQTIYCILCTDPIGTIAKNAPIPNVVCYYCGAHR